MNRTQLSIGLLTVTALVMAVLLVVPAALPPAQGELVIQGGEWILNTSSPSQSNDELLFITDLRTQKVLIYAINQNNKFTLVDAKDLTRDLTAPQNGPRR